MIDEYGGNYFLLSCDSCGITEDGPFFDFYEAVQHKKDNPGKWKSIRKCSRGKAAWLDVCCSCWHKEELCLWKSIPASKRPDRLAAKA